MELYEVHHFPPVQASTMVLTLIQLLRLPNAADTDTGTFDILV